jgi:hypothetical protein
MSTELIQVQEIVERSLYEKIRLKILELGYIPDISNDTLYPNNAQGKRAFDAAMAQIVNSQGFAIELFSVGAVKARGLKKVPRIVIQKGRLLPGQIGAPPGINYVPNTANDNFDGIKLPPTSTDYYLDIHLISNEERQDRVMNNIIGDSISTRAYVELLEVDPVSRFYIEQIGYSESADMDEGIIERVYQYRIPDLYITLKTVVGQASKITEIKVEQENIPNTDINLLTTPNP